MRPEDDWLCLEDIKILGKYSTYKEALDKEKQKSQTDDSSSDLDDVRNCKRKVRPNDTGMIQFHLPQMKRLKICQTVINILAEEKMQLVGNHLTMRPKIIILILKTFLPMQILK
ncbi:uncharacterized protein LOC116166180 [Photinus pyralis]|uniref:uncharacterized protein LOC116166180 n=1 Tax=Photinus pyralis TaxID=7054 RepID=UPI0012670BB2|nr:uncharacterized protein LOC116166180 [Photinus pyralis]